MGVAAGTKLGPYEIVSPIGAGGMGEVYRARDPRLDRTVAIKVSGEQFSDRFEREARAIAALSHPNICTLFDVGPNYLVMEYLQGDTLAERLKQGPLSVAEAVALATQVAEAVGEAHRAGIVHRDLKPGNIMLVKGAAKVLDFGLAKVAGTTAPGADEATRTMAAPLTAEGMAVGTPQYMSPEQVKGQEIDARSDIFSFGLVLYEMVTGRRAFRGNSQAELIASLLTSEAEPVTKLQAGVPPALEHLIRTCLEKDPAERIQSMHDVALQLRWIAQGGGQAADAAAGQKKGRSRGERLAWLAAGAMTVVAGVAGVLLMRQSPAPRLPLRFEEVVPPGQFMFGDMPSVSPDGRSFVYAVGRRGPTPVLWLRRLDQVEAKALPGTDDVYNPFWSPDGRTIGFYAKGELKTISADGGTPQVLCRLPGFSGGSWSREGVILASTPQGPIQLIPAGGGTPKTVHPLDDSRKEQHQQWPQFMPDGKHFLYTSFTADGRASIFAGSLDGEKPRMVLDVASNAGWAEPGLLVFGRERALMAQPFDFEKLIVSGSPATVADSVARNDRKWYFSTSPNGTLVYWPESSLALASQPTWYDRSGKRLGVVGEPRAYRQFTLSPDGKWVAGHIREADNPFSDIWVMNVSSGIGSRMTSGAYSKDTVKWSPDGREILFSAAKNGVMNLYRKEVGAQQERLVVPLPYAVFPGQWLPDGSILFLGSFGRRLNRLAPGEGAKPETLLSSDVDLDGPEVSPDGRWVVYNTSETGRWEVYLASYPSFANVRRISDNGGAQGHWRKDGKEIFYLTLEGELMSVQPGVLPEVGAPKPLFRTGVLVAAQMDQYAVTGDGERFLMLESPEYQPRPFTVVVDWAAGLKR